MNHKIIQYERFRLDFEFRNKMRKYYINNEKPSFLKKVYEYLNYDTDDYVGLADFDKVIIGSDYNLILFSSIHLASTGYSVLIYPSLPNVNDTYLSILKNRYEMIDPILKRYINKFCNNTGSSIKESLLKKVTDINEDINLGEIFIADKNISLTSDSLIETDIYNGKQIFWESEIQENNYISKISQWDSIYDSISKLKFIEDYKGFGLKEKPTSAILAKDIVIVDYPHKNFCQNYLNAVANIGESLIPMGSIDIFTLKNRFDDFLSARILLNGIQHMDDVKARYGVS